MVNSKSLLLYGVLFVLFAPLAVSADLVVTLSPTTQVVTVGSSGSFDVFLTGTSATADPVAGYTLTIADNAGVTYTNVTSEAPATTPYIFSTEGPVVQALNPNLIYVDTQSAGVDPVDVTATTTFSLGRVYFDAVAPGEYSFSFVNSQSGVFQSDFGDIPTTYVGGTVTIIPAAVPEPSSLALLGLTGAGALVWKRRRSRSATGTGLV